MLLLVAAERPAARGAAAVFLFSFFNFPCSSSSSASTERDGAHISKGFFFSLGCNHTALPGGAQYSLYLLAWLYPRTEVMVFSISCPSKAKSRGHGSTVAVQVRSRAKGSKLTCVYLAGKNNKYFK